MLEKQNCTSIFLESKTYYLNGMLMRGLNRSATVEHCTKLYVSEELIFTTDCRGRGLNCRPLSLLVKHSTTELSCHLVAKLTWC